MQRPLYLLTGTLYRNKGKDDSLIEIYEEFTDENPIEARRKAFKKYQSYVDVLFDSLEIPYQSTKHTEQSMQNFIDSNRQAFILDESELEMEVDFDKGLFLYFIPYPDKVIYSREKVAIYEENHCIYYIDNKRFDFRKYVQASLIIEFRHYEKFSFTTDNKKCWINKESANGRIKKFPILETPFLNHSV